MTRLAKALRRLLARHDAGAGKSLPFLDENTRFAALQKQLDALSESERGLRITLMSMGDGVITTDSKGSVTFLNPSAQELTGWTLEQAVGKPFSEVFRIENSMTGQPGEDIVEAVLTTRRKVSLSNHMVLISADGTRRHISDSAAPIHSAYGSVVGVVLIFSDVTERYRLQQQLKISEARSSAAVEMALLGTWEHDERANAVVWSPAYKRIMGVPEDFAPGPDFWKTRVHPDDLAIAVEHRTRAMATGERYSHQYRIIRYDDGALRYVKAHASFERGEDGKIQKMIGVIQDITEEMEAGERICESEELYRSAFEQAVIGMAHISLDGRFLRVNRSPSDIFQYAAEEMLGRPVADFVHPEDRALLHDTLAQITLHQSTTRAAVRRFIRRNGETAILSVSSSVIISARGEPRYVVTSALDVTASEQARMALARSEQRLRRAQEIANTGNWELDLATMRVWASDEAFRIYGLKKAEDNAVAFEIPKAMVVPEHRPMMDNALERLLRHDAPYDMEFRLRGADGGTRTVHSIAVAERDGAGRPLRVVGVLQDITLRRRIEEEYGKALSTTLDGFWLCDRNVRIVMANDAICAMTGYSREELIGMRICDLEAGADFGEMRARRDRVLSSGAERFESRIRRKDGSVFDVEVSLSYIISSELTCAFLRDITQRKRSESHIRYLSYHDALTGLYNRAFYEKECARLEAEGVFPVTVVMGDINGLKLTNDVFGHAQGDGLLKAIAAIIARHARPEDIVSRIGGDEFCVLMPGAGQEEARALCERVWEGCERETIRLDDGNALRLSVSMGCATRLGADQTFNSVFKQAEDAMYKQKLLERKSMHSSLIASIRTTMYEKSRETREHADRLARMAGRLVREMGLDESQVPDMELLCALHDLGKIGIPEQILDKPGPLTGDEWVEMRKHPEIGYRIAQASPELVSVAEGILCHHERWDGRGYPQGLKGADIPLLARILSVVDSFDAMTSDRAYRMAISREAALVEVEACAGGQFDPAICEAFVRMMRA